MYTLTSSISRIRTKPFLLFRDVLTTSSFRKEVVQLVPSLSSLLFPMLEKPSSFSISYFTCSRLPTVLSAFLGTPYSCQYLSYRMAHKWNSTYFSYWSRPNDIWILQSLPIMCCMRKSATLLSSLSYFTLCSPDNKMLRKPKKDRSMWFFQDTTALCTDSVTILHISPPYGRGWTLVLPWDKQEDYQAHKLHGRPGSCLVQAFLFPQATSFWRKPLIFGRQTRLGIQSIYQWQTNIKQWQTASSGFGEGLLGWRSTDSAFIQTNF